jgi:hypothetical protein
MQRLITLQRKQETRKKIQLGGLIIKAGLSEESASVLLGILVEAAEKLHADDSEIRRKHFQVLGDVFFSSSISQQEMS